MKKTISSLICISLTTAALTACAGNSTEITVISREEGSGTRGAFVELMGIMQDDKDLTTLHAETSQSTAVVLYTVMVNKNAVGYISLGSLSDEVKTISIDGVPPSFETVKDGTYKAARPFVVCFGDDLSDTASDFLDFILSNQGQAIIEEDGYISVADDTDYFPLPNASGKITVAGSTSVGPVMEKLADAYMKQNTAVTVEIQQTGSGAGITSTIEGACDIGMSSRDLKQEEIDKGLTPVNIAMDGIAVIVNKENTVNDLTSEQIMKIYTGEITDWNEVNVK